MNNDAATVTDKDTHKVVFCGDGCMNVILKISGRLTRGTNADIDHAVRRPGGNALVSALALPAGNPEFLILAL